MAAIAGIVWSVASSERDAGDEAADSMARMHALGAVVCGGIERTTRPAMDATERISRDPRVVAAMSRGDWVALTALANESVERSGALDAVAMFDGEGKIRAINTVYASGAPIDPARVARVMERSFDDRPIIQQCVRNSATESVLEFQTTCDITPAFFDSTGLSVAYSTPVVDRATGRRLGVVSARLVFDRITSVLRSQRFVQQGNDVFFVSDRGEYFDEAINRGVAAGPIPPEELRSMIEPLVDQRASEVVTKRQGSFVDILSTGLKTMDGGGIHVLLVGGADWLKSESGRKRVTWMLGATSIGVLVVAVMAQWRSTARLEREHAALARSKSETERAHAELKASAEERERLSQRLVEASRTAGMAEVASGVLHNVGNVLNSVNVATGVVARGLHESELASLVKAVAMLQEHAGDVAGFIERDPRGRAMPAFLAQVTAQLGREHENLKRELAVVMEGIDHVKHVISMQQSHAKRSGFMEVTPPADLMDAAILMQRESLQRHSVKIEREYEDIEAAPVDKHQILQILVNLISNAKQAVSGLAPEDRVIRCRVSTVKGARRMVRYEVTDHGVGIDEQDLTRIFGHGFTTRRDGHGFGLHSSANAAKAMGGTLTCSSRGLGMGATFVLEAPLGERALDASGVSPMEEERRAA